MQKIKKFRFFCKNKKGFRVSLEELGMMLLGIAVALLIFFVAGKLINMFTSQKEFDSTIASFELLGERIDEIINDKNYANTNLLYYLKKDIYLRDNGYILVGFNYKDSFNQIETCDNEPLTESKKKISSVCGKSCICIYENTAGEDFDKDKEGFLVPIAPCISFDKNIVFLASFQQESFCSKETGWKPQDAYDDYYQGEKSYKFLILRGFNTKEVYLDKYESKNGEIFIYMAEYKDDEKDPVYQRKQCMEKMYEGKKC